MDISEKSLYVKSSQLLGAGKGLFTSISIKKGDRIVEYKGRHVPWKVAKHQDGNNAYLLRLNRTTAIDGHAFLKTFGRYANDAKGFGKIVGMRNNAEYLIYGRKCFIVATRAIVNDEEILVGYGKVFWLLQREVSKRKSIG